MRLAIAVTLVCALVGCGTNLAEYEPKVVRDMGVVEQVTFHPCSFNTSDKTQIVTTGGSYMVRGTISSRIGVKVQELDGKYIRIADGDWVRTYKIFGR
jgi:hypothetical protein